MNVLITGVGGFIASHIARKFIKEGYHVIGVDDFSGGKRENVPNGVEFIEGDLANQATINKIPKNCSYILHLAGQSSGEMSFDDPILDLRKNSISTLNLINFGRNAQVKKMLFASSVSIYGSVGERALNENDICDPSSCYGVSKLAGEGYLRIFSKELPYVNMRMFNVYGPGQDLDNLRQGMVSIYLAQAIKIGNIHIKVVSIGSGITFLSMMWLRHGIEQLHEMMFPISVLILEQVSVLLLSSYSTLSKMNFQ